MKARGLKGNVTIQMWNFPSLCQNFNREKNFSAPFYTSFCKQKSKWRFESERLIAFLFPFCSNWLSFILNWRKIPRPEFIRTRTLTTKIKTVATHFYFAFFLIFLRKKSFIKFSRYKLQIQFLNGTEWTVRRSTKRSVYRTGCIAWRARQSVWINIYINSIIIIMLFS